MSDHRQRGPDWNTDGRDWPNRAASRFVTAGRLRWHVQQQGQGPVLLLVHGTGASTHSWRELLPLLAADFTVVAPDLPGHGFTECPAPERLSLPGMAEAVRALLTTLGVAPAVVVGHSAGAAVLARLCIDGQLAPRCFVSAASATRPSPASRASSQRARCCRSSLPGAPPTARYWPACWPAPARPSTPPASSSTAASRGTRPTWPAPSR
jgi:pimeloyl-ACP methyl ester carboxylesterase